MALDETAFARKAYDMAGFKDRACIVGIGETPYSRNSGKTELGLMLEASLKAIADAGLKPHDIDGVIPPRLYATAEHLPPISESKTCATQSRFAWAEPAPSRRFRAPPWQ